MSHSWRAGPIEVIPTSERSKRNRQLPKQTQSSPILHTKIIMRAGQIQMGKRFETIKQQIVASRALLDAQSLRPGFSAESPVTADRVSRPSEARSPKPNPDQPARPLEGAEQLMTKEPRPGSSQERPRT